MLTGQWRRRCLLAVVAAAVVVALVALPALRWPQPPPPLSSSPSSPSPYAHASALAPRPTAAVASGSPKFAWVAPERVLFVTATSANHFCVAVYAVVTAHRHHPKARILLYDLGVSDAQRRWLARVPFVELRAFDYARYPAYLNVTQAAGEYAWKPVVIADAMEGGGNGATSNAGQGAAARAAPAAADRAPATTTAAWAADVVVWMDAGDALHGALDAYWEGVWAAGGLYSAVSAGTVERWTHPGTLAALGVRPDDEAFLRQRNCNAAFIILFTARTYTDLVVPWRACALDRACIAPEGSSRANHRQDQAALTVLVHQRSHQYRTCTAAVPDRMLHRVYTIQRDTSDRRHNHCPS